MKSNNRYPSPTIAKITTIVETQPPIFILRLALVLSAMIVPTISIGDHESRSPDWSSTGSGSNLNQRGKRLRTTHFVT